MTNKQYTSDLTTAEWQVIEKKLPEQVVQENANTNCDNLCIPEENIAFDDFGS